VKKLYLLLVVCMLSVLTFAQTDSSTSSTDQGTDQILVTNGCVSLTPDGQDFGNQPVDFPSASKPFYLQDGCSGNIIVTNITANGQSFTQTNDCIGTLRPNQFCEIDAVFDPISTGQKNQTLVVLYHKQGSNNQLQISGTLSGTGIHDVTFDPTSCDFGSVPVGDDSYCTVTIQNQEPQPLTIDRCHVSPVPPFSQETSCPISLAKKGHNGDSVNITLDFRPSAVGVYSGQFAVTTNSPEEEHSGNSYEVPLSGVGLWVCRPPFCCNGSGPSCPPSD
jgi:hypothetical protein